MIFFISNYSFISSSDPASGNFSVKKAPDKATKLTDGFRPFTCQELPPLKTWVAHFFPQLNGNVNLFIKKIGLRAGIPSLKSPLILDYAAAKDGN
jgi:hypothetical protein